MDPQRVLAGLLHLAGQLGVEVRLCALRGHQASPGGLCKVNGKPLVLLNSKASPIERSYALGEALRPLVRPSFVLDAEVRAFLFRRGPGALSANGRLGPGLASTARHRRLRRPESR